MLELYVPEDEAQAVIVVLKRLLGDRVQVVEQLPKLPDSPRPLGAPGRSRVLRRLGILLAFGLCATGVGIATGLSGWDYAVLFVPLGMLGVFGSGVWFLLIIARAIGAPESAFKKKKRLARRRAKAPQGDLSHWRPYRSLVWGNILKGAGALAFLAGFVGVLFAAQMLPFQHAQGIIQMLCYLPATCLIYYGYRLSLRSAEDVRHEDHRAPILYLRSFELMHATTSTRKVLSRSRWASNPLGS